jgi:hypothetical protein
MSSDCSLEIFLVTALGETNGGDELKRENPAGVVEKSLLEGSRQLPNHVKEETEKDKGANDSDSLINHLKPSKSLKKALILL